MISKRLVAKSGKKRLLEAVANANPTLVPKGESPLAESAFLLNGASI